MFLLIIQIKRRKWKKKNYKILKKERKNIYKEKTIHSKVVQIDICSKKKINDHNDYFPIIKQIISNNVLGVYVYTHY